MRRTPVAVLAVLLLAGCSSPASKPATQPPAAPPTSAAVSAPASASPSVSQTAADIIAKLKAADLGLTHVAVQDEDTDPNDQLGRPNGYTSRASADLPAGDKDADKYTTDRGVVVEVFATPEQAKARSDYIQGLQKAAPILGSEWHYFTAGGTALVRVTGKVKPSQAKKFEQAVAGL